MNKILYKRPQLSIVNYRKGPLKMCHTQWSYFMWVAIVLLWSGFEIFVSLEILMSSGYSELMVIIAPIIVGLIFIGIPLLSVFKDYQPGRISLRWAYISAHGFLVLLFSGMVMSGCAALGIISSVGSAYDSVWKLKGTFLPGGYVILTGNVPIPTINDLWEGDISIEWRDGQTGAAVDSTTIRKDPGKIPERKVRQGATTYVEISGLRVPEKMGESRSQTFQLTGNLRGFTTLFQDALGEKEMNASASRGEPVFLQTIKSPFTYPVGPLYLTVKSVPIIQTLWLWKESRYHRLIWWILYYGICLAATFVARRQCN